MLVSMKQMLEDARKGGYAVMAINCFNLETMRTVIRAAKAEHSPIIINILQDHLQAHGDPYIYAMLASHLAQQTDMDVALNLDHGRDPELLKAVLDAGFTSVMADFSALPLEENIRETRKIADYAHSLGASIEAELGGMGSTENAAELTGTQMMTDPALAARFAEETDIDCLAVSYGSSHGTYADGYVPVFDFDRLKKIHETTDLPLVLHGGSGSGKDNVINSVANGICKINVGCDFMNANREAVKKHMQENPEVNYFDLMDAAEYDADAIIRQYINWAGCAGKGRK